MKIINKKIISACLCMFFLLVALGDLRNLVGPLGYWIIWGVVSLAGVFASEKKIIHRKYFLAFFILGGGFFISGSMNGDLKTLYQAGKIIICSILIFCILIVISNAEKYDLHKGMRLSLLVTLALFLCGKFFFENWLVMLGDGRQGVLVSYPGVMWKVGAFGFIYFLCLIAYEKEYKNTIFLFLSAALVVIDGSRTGFIFIVFSVFFVFLDFYKNNVLKYSLFLFFMLPVAAFVFLIFNMMSADFLAVNRLSAGDSERMKMLMKAIALSQECFPLGCGFGSAVVEIDGLEAGVMVIHNGYFDALIDGGVIAFIGFFLMTIGLSLRRLWGIKDGLSMFSFLGVAIFSFIMMLHPLSTEMSEWGWLALVAGVLHIQKNKKINV